MENNNPINSASLTSTPTPIPSPSSSQTIPLNQNMNQPPPPNNPPTNKTSKKRSIIAIFLLIFFYLFGLIFMWLGTKWPRWVKILVTAPIIIALFALIAIPIIGGYNLNKQKAKYPNVYKSPTPAPTITQINDRVINKRGGYSFVLPNGWKSKYSSFGEEDTIFGSSFLNDLGDGEIRVTERYSSLDDYISEDKNRSNLKPITINSIPGVIADFTSKDENSNFQISGRYAVFYKDGRTYILTLLDNDSEKLKKFQTLLDSFKFEKIETIPCGGLNRKTCPSGYSCKYSSNDKSSDGICKAFF